jgi:hypothetical protein
VDLLLKVPGGTAHLFVTRHDGLTDDRFPANDYVLKFIERGTAHALYTGMDVSNPGKVEHLVSSLPGGFKVEVPFLEEASQGPTPLGLECRNDAHVLEALYELGVNPIPVVLHIRHASLV